MHYCSILLRLLSLFVLVLSILILSPRHAYAEVDLKVDQTAIGFPYGTIDQDFGVNIPIPISPSLVSDLKTTFPSGRIYLRVSNPSTTTIQSAEFLSLTQAGFKWYFYFNSANPTTISSLVAAATAQGANAGEIVVELSTSSSSEIQAVKNAVSQSRVHAARFTNFNRGGFRDLLANKPPLDAVSAKIEVGGQGEPFMRLTYDTIFDMGEDIDGGTKIFANFPIGTKLSLSTIRYDSGSWSSAHLASSVASSIVSSVISQRTYKQPAEVKAPIRYTILDDFTKLTAADKTLASHMANLFVAKPALIWPRAYIKPKQNLGRWENPNGQPWYNQWLPDSNVLPFFGVLAKNGNGTYYGMLANSKTSSETAVLPSAIDWSGYAVYSVQTGIGSIANSRITLGGSDAVFIYPSSNVPPPAATYTPVPTQPNQTPTVQSPTPTTGGSQGGCTIQGFKTPVGAGNDVEPVMVKDSQGVSVGQASAQPYYFNGLTGGQSYTVQAGNGNGKLLGSTLCYNRTDCHGVVDSSNPDFQAGGSRMVTCPGSGYVDLWWHYAGPGVVPTPTSGPAGSATVRIKVQDAGGRPVEVLALYTFQCISGVHDCNAINFCERNVPIAFNTTEHTRVPVPIGGNICRVGVGAILRSDKMQMASVSLNPGLSTIQDQWVSAGGGQIEHNFGWGGLADGQTYEAVMTVNATPTPTLAAGMCWGVEHCTTGTGGTTYLEYCGNCGLYTTSGCNPSYTCRQPNYTCKAFAHRTFYFDEVYPVSCADIGVIPTATPDPNQPTVTPDPNQPTVTPVSAACEDQRVAGDYNCDGSINTNDFKDWLRDFLAGTAELKYLEYWRRAFLVTGLGGPNSPTATPILPTATSIPGLPTHTPTATVVPPTATSGQGSIVCPTTSTQDFRDNVWAAERDHVANTVPPFYPAGDPLPALHPDLNLAIRGFISTTGSTAIINQSGNVDPKKPPQLSELFHPFKTSSNIVSLYQVYNWDWAANTKGGLMGNPSVTMVGLSATPNEPIYVPVSDHHLGENIPDPAQVNDPYHAAVLYVDANRITLKYSRADHVVQGYTLHIEDVCIDPNLVATYNAEGLNNPAVRHDRILMLRGSGPNQDSIGVAKSNEIKVSIRAEGAFMDPRSKNSWWRNVAQ